MSWLVGTISMKIYLGAHLQHGILSSSSQLNMANLSILLLFGGLLQVFCGFQPIGYTKTNFRVY